MYQEAGKSIAEPGENSVKETMIIILGYLKENRHNEKRNGRYNIKIKWNFFT